MSSHTTFSAHILLVAVPAWGHVRPLVVLACKAIQERQDLAITFLTAGNFGERAEREISRYFPEKDGRLRENIRVVSVGGPGLGGMQMYPAVIKEFGAYYQTLLTCQPIQCSITGRTYDAVPKPTAAIIDFLIFPILQIIRSMTARTIPVFTWAACNGIFFLRTMAPERLGGRGDVTTKARLLAESSGRPVEQIIDELYHPSTGAVVNVPGLPPMYDYEWSLREPGSEILHSKLFAAAYHSANDWDGVVSSSSSSYEAGSMTAIRTWFGETNRKLFAVGPLVPPGCGYGALSGEMKRTEIDSSKNGTDIENFLNKTLKTHGKNSLVYISFGSLWWPKDEYVWVWVDTLIDLGIPFIMSHASPEATIPSGYVERVEESGLGLLTPWAPQQLILNHPALGWFLTHCGQNSVFEALSQGIPMITWPLSADEPANATHLTLTLDVAFELIEVRLAGGLKPLYRGVQPVGTVAGVAAEARTVLAKALSAEGVRKRQNAELVKDALGRQWEEGGEAITDLRMFLADVTA